MPRSTTPVRNRAPVRDVSSTRGTVGFSGRNKEITEMKETIKHQEEMIEKQGALLLGHAQLLHEMREEIVRLREGGMGEAHTKQLTQLTTVTLKNMSSNFENVQRDVEWATENVKKLSIFTGCPVSDQHLPLDQHITPTFSCPETPHPEEDMAPIVAPEEFRDYLNDTAESEGRQAMQLPVSTLNTYTPKPTNDIGNDLYRRGMAQKKKRASEIAQRQRTAEEEDLRVMRIKPEISHLAKRSKSSDKSISARTDEWKEKREKKRESLRTEMKKLEEESLRASPNLNPNSIKIASQSHYRRASSTSPRHIDLSESPGVLQATPPSSPLDMSSPPPLDELLERLRKRRELLGLCTSQSPERISSSSIL
eukprot:TRINITY_DN2234_c0_g1_i2.p1 TRINITY_DN2234_c0_g1~~TRINITY_DN2234_c0_g1_i2.p1  ORF type:complete len:366 (+),score=79.47 TRINITY_DN2234_c0_g1_i2:37-1134(+)